MTENNIPLVQASELARYDFCHRAWWLGTVKGIRSANAISLAQGAQHHRRHANRVRAALRWRYIGLVLLGIGCFLFVLTVIFSLL